jgi:two-component system LytT family response regulator
MKRAIIIDDEPLARSIAQEYLIQHPDIELVGQCGDGFEGVKAIQQLKPDIIFLDIQMPKISGFEMLELIDDKPAIIFTTAFDEYAIKAFETNAIDYLLKPYSQERFDLAIDKWRSSANKPEEKVEKLLNTTQLYVEETSRIVIKSGSDIRIVPTQDIHYIEAYDDYVKIFTKETYYLKKKTMNYYESILNTNDFFRSHRSFIVNLKELTRIEPMEKNSYVAVLRSGKKIPVSRTSYSQLKEKLGI